MLLTSTLNPNPSMYFLIVVSNFLDDGYERSFVFVAKGEAVVREEVEEEMGGEVIGEEMKGAAVEEGKEVFTLGEVEDEEDGGVGGKELVKSEDVGVGGEAAHSGDLLEDENATDSKCDGGGGRLGLFIEDVQPHGGSQTNGPVAEHQSYGGLLLVVLF